MNRTVERVGSLQCTQRAAIGNRRRNNAVEPACRRSVPILQIQSAMEPMHGGRASPSRIEAGEPRSVWSLIETTVDSWLDDYAPSMGAALAYYTMFSIAPLLLIVISFAGLVFGQEAASGEIFRQLRDLIGDPGAQAVQAMVASVTAAPAESSVGALIGLVLLLVGATSVFGELQDALDRIWRPSVWGARDGGV